MLITDVIRWVVIFSRKSFQALTNLIRSAKQGHIEAEIFKDGCCTNHESYGAYPAVTATAVEYCLVTLVIRAAKQKGLHHLCSAF